MNLKPLAVVSKSVLVFALGCLVALCACAADSEAETRRDDSAPLPVSDAAMPAESSEVQPPDPAPAEPLALEEPDRDTLYALLEQDEADRLIALAQTDEEASWIAAHPDAYAVYDTWAQVKLLKLAADDPWAVPYVRSFADKGYVDEPNPDAPALRSASPSKSVPDTDIPHFYQWDLRWGNTIYNNGSFGVAGCGPTSFAMIYQGLTGKDDISPLDMGRRVEGAGYAVLGQGTSNSAFAGLSPELGLECWSIPINGEVIRQTLSEGHPLIAEVGIGYFSTMGHYFVLAGLTDDGQVILNDPYSATRSAQLWDPEFIASECVSLFAFALK